MPPMIMASVAGLICSNCGNAIRYSELRADGAYAVHDGYICPPATLRLAEVSFPTVAFRNSTDMLNPVPSPITATLRLF